MAAGANVKILSGRPLASLLFCLAAVLFFVLLIILPNYLEIRRETQQINEIKARIDEQKILKPFLERLESQVKSAETEMLTIPKEKQLPRNDLASLSKVFSNLASQAEMVLQSLVPQVNTFKENEGRLAVDLDLTGEFFNFRRFLNKLGAVPFVSHIETISINASKDYRIRIWVVMERKSGK